MNKLYVATQSWARHRLLREAGIPFEVSLSNANEREVPECDDLTAYVEAVAAHKMSGVKVPAAVVGQKHYILTGDCAVQTALDRKILHKPRSREEAKMMLQAIREQGLITATGMCLRIVDGDVYHDIVWHVQGTTRFCVPDDEMDHYLDACPRAMHCCGGAYLYDIGTRYFDEMSGSYTGRIGLDIPTLYRHLKKHDFFTPLRRA